MFIQNTLSTLLGRQLIDHFLGSNFGVGCGAVRGGVWDGNEFHRSQSAHFDIPQTLCKNSEMSSSNAWGTSIVCSAYINILICIKERG